MYIVPIVLSKKAKITANLFHQGLDNYDLDKMALSACVGMSVGHGRAGHVIAVRRMCSNIVADCATICSHADSFGGSSKFSCFDSLHVCQNRPNLESGDDGKVSSSQNTTAQLIFSKFSMVR